MQGTRVGVANDTTEESEWYDISLKLKTDVPVTAIRATGAVTPHLKNQGLQ